MTKKVKLLFAVCFVSIAVVLSASDANATSIAFVKSRINDNLQFNPGGSYTAIRQGSFSQGVAFNELAGLDIAPFDFSPSFFTPGGGLGVTLSEGNVGTAWGRGRTTPADAIRGRAFAQATWPTGTSIGVGVAGRFIEFSAGEEVGQTVSGSSGYLINFATLSTDLPGEFAGGFGLAGLFMANLTTGEHMLSGDFKILSVADGLSLPTNFNFNGPLGVSLYFNQDDVGFFAAVAASGVKAEPVPEPTTMALFGIGLVGLAGGAARRKLKKKELVKH